VTAAETVDLILDIIRFVTCVFLLYALWLTRRTRMELMKSADVFHHVLREHRKRQMRLDKMREHLKTWDADKK
jgi:hypothetical protein